MAIFHSHVAIVKRSAGHSSIAAAAYRTGERFIDERTGEIYDYKKRGGVVHSQIFAPDNTPDWACDRHRLWNEVERVEQRKDAQLCRTWDIALPSELTPEQRLEITRAYCQNELVSRGMVVDVSIHRPHKIKNSNNHHIHIAATMRVIGPVGFGNKCRDWNRPELIETLREQWACYVNEALEKSGHDARIDHRSYSEQGIDKVPQKHLGKAASVMEHRGADTEQGTYNRKVIELEEVREKRKQADKELMIVNQEIHTIKAVIIDLQTEREKRRQNHIKERLAPIFTDKCLISGDESTSSGFNSHHIMPGPSHVLPAVEQVKLIDKLNEHVNKLQQQLSVSSQQVQEFEKLIPTVDAMKTYLAKAEVLVCPQKIQYNNHKEELHEQLERWEVENFHWRDKGDRKGWKRDGMKPHFLKSSERLAWEVKGKELAEIKERLTTKIITNNKQLQDIMNFLNSPQAKHAIETKKNNLIDADFPSWRIDKDRKEQMEEQRKSLWNKKSEFGKLVNDLNTYFPSLNIEMSRKEDIRSRIRQPDILHLIRLIEQVKAKKLTRKRHEEMTIGGR